MGRLSFSENMRFKKSVVSWIYDGMFCNRGFRMKSAYCESFTVGPPQPDMIGLPGMSGLYISGSMYSVGGIFWRLEFVCCVVYDCWSSCIF